MDSTGELIDDEAGIEKVEEKMEDDNPSLAVRTRHVLEIISACGGDGTEQIVSIVHQCVHEQLRNWGIEIEPPTTRGRSKSRKSNNVRAPAGRSELFGSNRLVEVKLTNWDVTVKVPVLIKETCDFLRKHIKTEGIFRKSGSSSRVQALMQRFANLDKHEEFEFVSSDTVFDVATVLKQYLREMDSPLIPYDIHHLFRKCLDVPSESSREEAVLLCTCLLPEFNISILTYLVEFLVEVVECSKENRMSFENLAIVIGPNIMPLDVKKTDKAKELELERKFIESHTKIVEMLIRNCSKLGCVPSDLEKKIESDYSVRGSEDELENDGATRRKKRRSGSLTRVLGFLRKVASNKASDTPVAHTPVDFSDFTHTPVMKSSKRRCLDENIFSLQKKKHILDGIRKNGITVKDDDKRFSHITDTPNSIVGFITCPSPVCLNPSPMKMEWKQTPNAGRFKHLVTPSLLRRKEKNVADLAKNIAPFSEPAKPVKARARLGIGKKSSKKQAVTVAPPVLADNNGSKRINEIKRMESTQSIHKLVQSPKKPSSVIRAASTRIPRPDKVNPVRKSNSSCRFPLNSPLEAKILDMPSLSSKKPFHKTISGLSGEYVTISPSAKISDEKNEAFIASKLSCLEDTVDLHQQENDRPGQGEPLEAVTLRLTPLIQEINTLTLTAQEEVTPSGLRRKRSASKISCPSTEKAPPIPSRATRRRSSGASVNKARLQSPTESKKASHASQAKRRSGGGSQTDQQRHNMETRSKSIRAVEEKFSRAMKETKIMRIQSERSAQVNSRAVNIHRRFSVQDRGFSPSQRRINAARRKSNEMEKRVEPTSTKTTTTSGMTTPMNDLARYGQALHQTSSISRSPNRCTLKRGRPNTLRSGLARPSPVSSRNTSKLNDSISKENPPSQSQPPLPASMNRSTSASDKNFAPTPMRRMSSVQELVQIMEKVRNENKEKPDNSNNSLKPVNKTEPPPQKRTLSRRTSSASKFAKPTSLMPKMSQRANDLSTPISKKCIKISSPSEGWTPASDFNFETHRSRFLQSLGGAHNEDRDSIQALKTLNAGKVSQNVKLFDGMCRTRKSPGKSLIPRYVALQRHETSARNNNSNQD